MGNILYVGALSFEATEQDLKALFSRAGQVKSVSIVTDRMNGQPRGYAFVEMATDAEAQAAIESLNGEEVSGRKIKIQERSGGGIRDRSRGRNSRSPSAQLYPSRSGGRSGLLLSSLLFFCGSRGGIKKPAWGLGVAAAGRFASWW